jgi:hypothetical protein
MEVVDWKPFRYYTIVGRSPFGEMDMTVELTPLDDATRVSCQMRGPGEGAAGRRGAQPEPGASVSWFP